MADTKEKYRRIKSDLINASLKATNQRIFIYEALYALNHPTAEAIFRYVAEKQPSVSLGTIYKTLDTFVKAGLAERISTEAGAVFDWNTKEHHHIYCHNTSEIIDFEDSKLNSLIEEYLKRKKISNAVIKGIKLEIKAEKIDPTKEINIL